MHMPFDGIPFILLSTREYQCQQGNNKNISEKKKYIENEHQKLCWDHPQHIKLGDYLELTK